MASLSTKRWAGIKPRLSAIPEYGKTGGRFTKVNPEEVNLGSTLGWDGVRLKRTAEQYRSGS